MSAPTVVQGTRGTVILDTETRRTRDVSKAVAYLEGDSGPLLTFLSRLRKRAATDPKFEWFEDELLPRFDVLGGALGAGDGTMTVTQYKYFRKGDLVRVNKSEVVHVTTTPTSTTVTVTRGFGEVSAKAAASGTQLHILSNSNEEGATVRSIISTQRVPKYNYTQIIRDPYSQTKTAKATSTYAGNDFTEEAAKQLIEHKKHIEYAIMLGHRYEYTSGTHPERTTRGLDLWITSNVTAINGELSEGVWDDLLRQWFRYGNKQKFLAASPIVMQAITGFAKDKLQTVSGKLSYGVTLQSYTHAGKTVLLNEHVLMMNDGLNDFSGIGGQANVIDIGDLTLRYLNGRMSVHNANIQANDADLRTDEYLSEVGLQLAQERKHGRATGVSG